MSTEIKILLKEARESLKQNEFEDVVKKCKSILQKDKNNYNALILMAVAMKGIEKYKSQRLLVLQRAIQIQPDNALAWQGLVACYENDSDNNDYCSELVLAYCKLIQIDSNSPKFPSTLNKLSELCSKLKDDTVLIKCIDRLSELRGVLDEAKVILLNKTLASILTDNSHNLNKYDDLLENILTSLINDANVVDRKVYYRKYLRVLYNTGKLTTLITEVIRMSQQFLQDISPLEYACRAYYEQSILEGIHNDVDVSQFYEPLLQLNVESEAAIIAKATYLQKTNDLILAREMLKEMLMLKPHSLYGWIILSKIRMSLYCWEDAENAIRQALKLEEHKTNDKLKYIMEIILMESMSRNNNKHKWEMCLEICENHLKQHPSSQLELIYARIGVLLNHPDVHIKLRHLESQPETKVQATVLRALYFKRNKQLEEAANILDSALETSEAWLLQGLIYWEMAEYNYSLMAFLKGIKSDRYNWECFVYLGHYYRRHGNMERSRRCYETALQIHPSSEEAGIGLSTAYRLLKNQDANIQLLQRLTIQDNAPKWAWLQLGLQYLDQADAVQAIKAFQRVIRADPTDNHCWESLGDAYYMRGAHTSALKSYHRALELCPRSLYPLIQLANIKLVIGHYSEAQKDFEQILLNKSHYIPALKGFAETCLALAKENIAKQFHGRANSNLQQAIDSLTVAIMEHKDMSCVWTLLGDVCYRAAILPEKYSYLKIMPALMKADNIKDTMLYTSRDLFLLCTRCYCRALSLSPHSALLWHNLASCYLMQLHLDAFANGKSLASKCLAAAKYAVKLCPSFWLHWNLLGVICMSPHIRNYALAQHAYVMAIDKVLNNATVWSNLGTLYLYIGNLHKANEAYAQATRSDPAYVNSWIGQALIAELLHREEVVDLFRHSTQLGYHDQAAIGYAHWVITLLLNSNTKNESLDTYIRENMHAIFNAADLLNWYTECHPNDCHARNAYGLLLERQKHYKSAVEQYSVATYVSTNEEKNLVCINLARTLIHLGKYNEATELCRTIKGINYNSQCHYALSLFKAAQYEESYTAYEVALHSFPNTKTEEAYTLCAMAAIAYILEKVDDAKTLLFQCIQIQPPVITGFLAAASLGMLHGDLNLTTLVLQELQPYKDHSKYGHDVANLSAYFYLIENNTKSAIATLSKAIGRHPSDVRYWIRLLCILLETDIQTFRQCVQKTMYLSKNTVSTYTVHVACASSFSCFTKNSLPSDTRTLQKLVFTYPDRIETWATFIAAFLSRSTNTTFNPGVQWLLRFITIVQESYQCTNSMVKWLHSTKRKLTQLTQIEGIS